MENITEMAYNHSMFKTINDRISFITGTKDPLSSDVAIIRCDSRICFFDVGAGEEALAYINSVSEDRLFIISHFHRDHIANAHQIDSKAFLGGKRSISHIGKGTVLTEKTVIDDGVHLEILPYPNSHCKDSLILTVDGCYTFIGDALGPQLINGRQQFNTQLLKTDIDILSSLETLFIVSSHEMDRPIPVKDAIDRLRQIYSSRDPSSAYIPVNFWED